MKLGILLTAYNVEPYIHDCLAPFLGRGDCVISAVSVPFAEYRQQEFYEDGTTQILQEYKNRGEIDHLVIFPRFLKESDARNLALEKLKEENVDFLLILDGDEVYREEQVDSIIQFIEENNSVWYRLCLKNFVFDKEHYLEEPFAPPRIFRMETEQWKLNNFYWDNDISYWNKLNGGQIKYDDILKNQTIPKEIAWIDHYSWLSDEIGKRKTLYQLQHFGLCSYDWDEEENKLIFNEDYYKKTGQQKPKILSISDEG